MGNQQGGSPQDAAELQAKGIRRNPTIQKKIQQGGGNHVYNSTCLAGLPRCNDTISVVVVKVVIRGDRETGKSGTRYCCCRVRSC
jgi:hypothetical protein